MGLTARRSKILDPRTLPAAPPRPAPDDWAADMQLLEQWLDASTKLRLWELLDADSQHRAYSTPPEWEHRLRLDCVRILQWLRVHRRLSDEHPTPLHLSSDPSPYWQAVTQLVANQLGIPVCPVGTPASTANWTRIEP